MSDLFSGRKAAGHDDVPATYEDLPYEEHADPDAPHAYADEHDVEHPDEHDDEYPDEHALFAPAGSAPHVEQTADRSRSRRKSARRRRTAVIMAICLALLGGAVYVGYSFLVPLVQNFGEEPPQDYAGPGSGTATVVVNPGDSGIMVGDSLVEAGVILSRGAFVAALQENPDGGQVQPGTYALQQEMAASQALERLLDPAAKQSVAVQVREGLWVSETMEQISEDTGFSVEELQLAAQDPAVGLPPEADGDPEGYLFPANYDFDPDVTPVQVLAAMVQRHEQAMEAAGIPAAERRDVLIRASIVQGEGSADEDFAKVATVIENRLERGETLGMDSTVGYAVQKRALDLTVSDLEVDSPYNTRVNTGLPPGPINSPGDAAIAAAANPAEGDWLYFVTTNPDTGETVFTADYDEFLAAKREFNEWLAQNG